MNRPLYPIIAIFIIINIAIFIFSKALVTIGFDIPFLLGSNAVIFLLTVFGFALQAKGSRSSNVNAFIRGIYSSLLLKLFVVVGAILVYVFVIGKEISNPSLFAALVLYLLYTCLEVVQLMKIVKKPNA